MILLLNNLKNRLLTLDSIIENAEEREKTSDKVDGSL